jgi:hypothetical protein
MPRLPLMFLFVLLPAIAGAQSMPSPTPATGPAPLPTPAEVHKLVDDGQYRDALKDLLRILDLKGPPAAAYDRAEMLQLRAECQLQLRQTQAAQASLDAVVKEARGNNDVPPNPDRLGQALALSALVAKSTTMLYTPRNHTGPLAPKPINILDRAARPAACKALFDDSLADVKTKVRTAQDAAAMPPILDAAKAVATLRALEKAGTGDDVQSKPIAAELATRAVMRLGNSVADLSGTVRTIADAANLVYSAPVQRVDRVTGVRTLDQISRRRGLVGDEPARLKSIRQTCAQIITACLDLQLALDASDDFNAIANNADAVAQRAGKALTDDYSRPSP